jgi:hypothetical protein
MLSTKTNPNMKKTFALLLLLALSPSMLFSQKGPARGGNAPGGRPGGGDSGDSWMVTVNQMDDQRRERITRTVESLQERGGANRAVITSILAAVGMSGLNSLIDIASSEVIKLAKYPQTQKQNWMRMIQNECSYTDSLSSIRGLQDFYKETSRYGALDPSNINFDGISVRGVRSGQEVLYLTCHIDTTRLAHLFQHSKFYLVVDTICFHPYSCHLPNLSANGIRLSPGENTERDNQFSYDERDRLTVGMELSLSSSWINEAVMVQRNVELGRFNLQVPIPSGTEVYSYSRREIEQNRHRIAADPTLRDKLDTNFVNIQGDCFVVPRSFMPISGTEPMWGTGEYNMKVKISETCSFVSDENRNIKMKEWKQDYKRLRKMQKKGSEVGEYFKTLWQQNGNNLIKTMVRQSLTSTASAAGLTSSASGARTSGAGGASASSAAAGATGAGASAAGTPPAGGPGGQGGPGVMKN